MVFGVASFVRSAGRNWRKVQRNFSELNVDPSCPKPVPFRVQVGLGLLIYAPKSEGALADNPIVCSGAENFLGRKVFQGWIGKGDEGFFVIVGSGHKEEA